MRVCVRVLASVHLAAALVSCLCGLESVDVLCWASGAASKRSIDGCCSDRQTVATVDRTASAKVTPRSEVPFEKS